MTLAYSTPPAATEGLDFQTLFAALPTPIAVVDAGPFGPRFVEASDLFLEQLGLLRLGVTAGGLDDIFLTEQRLRFTGALDRCLATQQPTRFRITQGAGADLVRRDVVVSPIRDLALRDHVLLTVETASRPSTISQDNLNLFDRLGPLSSSMIYVYDLAKKRTRYIHKELTALLGLSPVAVDLNDIRARMHPDDLPQFADHLATLRGLGDDEIASVTVRMRSAKGDWLWVHQRARMFSRSADGAVRRVIGAAMDVTQHRALTDALEDASKALATAEAAERRRIGRELHDSTSQHLVAIDLSLSTLERRRAFADPDREIVRDLRQALTAAQREIRSFSYMLHPPQLEERGLGRTLLAFADGFGRRTELAIRISIVGEPSKLPTSAELALFRIVQEALMNTHRHAGARSATVRLGYGAEMVTIEVEDDGAGMNPAEIETVFDREAGVGVSGMRARMTQHCGELILEPGDKGLRVRARLPLPLELAGRYASE